MQANRDSPATITAMDVPRREGEAQREDTIADASSQPAARVALGPGDVVAEKFVVERVLGLGGMAQVLAARHLKLGTRVAIKVVHPQLATDPQAVARFVREAQAMASLQSEHAVRVHDVGELPDGVPYLIMDYLEGRDLGALLVERGALPVPLALEYIRQVCDALIEAHAVGIIHRDVKPQNIFVVRKPSGAESVRVLDFGLAKAVTTDANANQLTKAGHIMGTAYYMAPEQLYAAGVIDARTDVWSVGAEVGTDSGVIGTND
jgi:eukaryotic-like serine/threonine-protein kinase